MTEELLYSLINMPETYIGEAPISIDNCQWIRSTAGSSNVYFTKTNYDKPTFSIYVRRENNEQGVQVIQEIFKRIRNYSGAGNALLATRTPAFVGKDEKHRSVYVCQFEYQTSNY